MPRQIVGLIGGLSISYCVVTILNITRGSIQFCIKFNYFQYTSKNAVLSLVKLCAINRLLIFD